MNQFPDSLRQHHPNQPISDLPLRVSLYAHHFHHQTPFHLS